MLQLKPFFTRNYCWLRVLRQRPNWANSARF